MSKGTFFKLILICVWSAALFLFQGTNSANKQTGRVFFVSPEGNDAAKGSKERPWKTMTRAVTQLKPGDTLYVRKGTYTTNVELRASGTTSTPITIAGFPGERPLFVGPAVSPGEDADTLRIYGSHIIVHNLRITNNNNPGQAVWVAPSARHVTIQNSEIFGAKGQGVLISGSYTVIKENDIHHNGTHTPFDHGIYLEGGNNRVVSNTIHHNWTFGVQLYREEGVGGDNRIEDNYIYANGFGTEVSASSPPNAGIVVANGHPRTVIARNRVCGNARYGIYVIDEQRETTIEDNITCYNGGGGIYTRFPGAQTTVVRNISYNDRGFALSLAGGVHSDYNIYFASRGGVTLRLEERVFKDLKRFQTSTKQDAHSKIRDPKFTYLPRSRFDSLSASRYNFCTALKNSFCKK